MWARRASDTSIDLILAVDGGAPTDRRQSIAEAIKCDACWVAGRSIDIEGFLILKRRWFFGRDFIAVVAVSPAARRVGLASALIAKAENACDGAQLFTSTNESNQPMRTLLAKRNYLAAGVVTHLDPGDPELFFVKEL